MFNNLPAWVQAQIVYSNFGVMGSSHTRLYHAARVAPVPVFNISEWDEVRVRTRIAHKFNHRTAEENVYVHVG